MRNPFRPPSVKSLIVPRKMRRKTNLVPSSRTVASKTGRRVTPRKSH